MDSNHSESITEMILRRTLEQLASDPTFDATVLERLRHLHVKGTKFDVKVLDKALRYPEEEATV